MSRVRGLLHENRESIDALVRKHRGISVSVFGSVARGDETENSDIDFLVQFETEARYLISCIFKMIFRHSWVEVSTSCLLGVSRIAMTKFGARLCQFESR